MTRIEMDPDWQRNLDVPVAELLERLGTEIEADAKEHCPVRTGKLRESLHHVVEGDEVRIGSDLDYAGYVEEGHRIVAWGHETGRFEEPQPFLRPALYKPRGA
ncbi:HK97 gp10 family phage protein [Mycobacterium sp.]|uniref:HK97 gp10 family phage protein n=1 Tax=Mycobacterium sp. TaxID=1785 RepID=UPI002615825C|nr:HK97 gp10 family phage protein [Mycobacterium sp.]